jgi:hypothetical protein
MVNTLTLVKDKDIGMKLELAKPAVDQPACRVDRREVEKMLCSTSPLWLGPQLPCCSLLLALNNKTKLYKKREH